MDAIIRIEEAWKLLLVTYLPADRHPAAVYLASLASPHSRRNMHRYLDQIAALLTGGQADALTLDWAALRYPHVQAVRTHVLEQDVRGPQHRSGLVQVDRGRMSRHSGPAGLPP